MKPDAPKVHDTARRATSSSRRPCRSATWMATSPPADRVIRRTLRWHRASAQPLETAGAVCRFDPVSQRMDVWSNTNMINYVGWLARQHPQGPGEQAQHPSPCTWAAASAPSTSSARSSASPACWPSARAARSSSWRTASTTCSPPRTSPATASTTPSWPSPATGSSRACASGGRRLRRLLPVRPRHPRQCAGPGHRPLSHGELRVHRAVRAHQQVPAGRVPRGGLGRRQLLPGAPGRRGGPGARHRPRRDPPAQLHRAGPLPLQDAVRERLRQRRLPGRPRPRPRDGRPTPSCGACRRRRAQAGRYVGIGLATAQQRSVYGPTEFWFWYDTPGPHHARRRAWG